MAGGGDGDNKGHGNTDHWADGEGFDSYKQTTFDPGHSLLLATCLFSFGVMLLIVPAMVYCNNKERQRLKQVEKQLQVYNSSHGTQFVALATDSPTNSSVSSSGSSASSKHEDAKSRRWWSKKSSSSASARNNERNSMNDPDSPDFRPKIQPNLRNIVRWDDENRRILKLAIPYSLSALASSLLDNGCLIIISQYLGVNSMAAYALVSILLELTDGILMGPVYSCTTLCSHAVGAGNNLLAGNYLQLAVLAYVLCYIPVVSIWYRYMYSIILWLEWGDEETAQVAHTYTKYSLMTTIVTGVSSAIWELLQVTNHAWQGTVISVAWGVVNLIVTSIVAVKMYHNGSAATLQHLGIVYLVTSIVFTIFTIVYATFRGWLTPFKEGLYMTASYRNPVVVKNLLKQGIPLSFGSLLTNAEWTVLTLFASHLGPAEVAAWALLGSIWGVFYATTAGLNDAAEIRVARHLGDGHATMARLSAYKSLYMGMMVASAISIFYFLLQNQLPRWFTTDATLQSMLRDLVPFVGVANLTMTFGMQCWSLIGAQGKYKMATWISFFSSWGVTMPLAAVFCYGFRINLQGLTSAVVIGYVTTGAALSYVLLSTDWYHVSRKIRAQNQDVAAGNDGNQDDQEEELYASMNPRKKGALAKARRSIRLVSLQAGMRSGLVLGNIQGRKGTHVLLVHSWSSLINDVKSGDAVLAIDGRNMSKARARTVADQIAKKHWFLRNISITSPDGEDDEDQEGDDEECEGYIDFSKEPIRIEEIAEDEIVDIQNLENRPASVKDRTKAFRDGMTRKFSEVVLASKRSRTRGSRQRTYELALEDKSLA